MATFRGSLILGSRNMYHTKGLQRRIVSTETNICPLQFYSDLWGAGMVPWWDHSPPTIKCTWPGFESRVVPYVDCPSNLGKSTALVISLETLWYLSTCHVLTSNIARLKSKVSKVFHWIICRNHLFLDSLFILLSPLTDCASSLYGVHIITKEGIREWEIPSTDKLPHLISSAWYIKHSFSWVTVSFRVIYMPPAICQPRWEKPHIAILRGKALEKKFQNTLCSPHKMLNCGGMLGQHMCYKFTVLYCKLTPQSKRHDS